jgi:peptidyl-prolyl cis-trans isomerase SurA
MKWLLSFGILSALAAAPAHAQFQSQAQPQPTAPSQETRIVAVVNNDIITANDVEARLNLIMKSSGIPDTPQSRQQLGGRVVRTLIDEKLQMQEAARFKISVPKDEVERALVNIETRNNMQKGGLDAYLKSAGIPRASLVDQITASMTWTKVVQGRYSSDVSVSDAEVADQIAHIKADFGKPQSHVAEIFLAVDNPTQDAEVKGLADRLIDQIRSGANFPVLAQQFSQSPSAATGGDIGWVTPSQFGPPLDDAIAKMNPGEISYPIRTPAGYYVLFLIERQTPGEHSVDDTQLSLVEVVFPLSPGSPPAEEQRVTAQAQQVSNTAKSCGEMAKIARDEAPQLSSQTPNVRAGDVPPELREIVMTLQPSEPSKPVPMRGGIGVVMVCQRTDPPSAVPSNDQVYDQIMRQRLDQMARRYLRDLRRSAYVDIRG